MSSCVYDIALVGAKQCGKTSWLRKFISSNGGDVLGNALNNTIYLTVHTSSGNVNMRIRECESDKTGDLESMAAVIIAYDISVGIKQDIMRLASDTSLNSFVVGLKSDLVDPSALSVKGLRCDSCKNSSCGKEVFTEIVRDIFDVNSVRVESVSISPPPRSEREEKLEMLIVRLEGLLMQSRKMLNSK